MSSQDTSQEMIDDTNDEDWSLTLSPLEEGACQLLKQTVQDFSLLSSLRSEEHEVRHVFSSSQ